MNGNNSMENTEKTEIFCYSYSAKEQDEIKKIRQKYMPQEMNKMEYLRKLDEKVTQKASTYSLTVGILGTLLFGSGMSLIMTNQGEIIGFIFSFVGVLLGIIGIGFISFAYPFYKHILKNEREKITPEILRLTDELMKK